jgi:hypothetical protein
LGGDHVDLAGYEIDGEGGLPIITALRPTVCDRQVLPIDEAGFTQASLERGYIGLRASRRGAQETDYRHGLLLRAGGERPIGGPTSRLMKLRRSISRSRTEPTKKPNIADTFARRLTQSEAGDVLGSRGRSATLTRTISTISPSRPARPHRQPPISRS